MANQVKPYNSKLQAGLLLLPTIIVLLAFLYYPAVQTFRLSLYETLFLAANQVWVGIENYVQLATSEAYRNSFIVTIEFAIVVVIGTILLSLCISYMLYQVKVMTSTYLIASIWPYALAPAVAAIILNFLLHPNLGIFTYYFEKFTPWGLNWFANGAQAFAVLSIVAIWKQLGYNIIFMVAALNNIPETLTESAKIDGVGHLKMLYRVYVPLITPTLVFLVVMNTIFTFFSTFAFVDIMTKGGPSGATYLLIYKLFRDAFAYTNYGLAAAQSVILFVFVAILMYIQLRASEDYVHMGA